MYAFQLSEPDSRPPPVSFSPPNAPPISPPLVPRLTYASPQSLPDPHGLRNPSHDSRLRVKIAELSPCCTPFWSAIASSRSLNVNTYRIGANVSSWAIGSLLPAGA